MRLFRASLPIPVLVLALTLAACSDPAPTGPEAPPAPAPTVLGDVDLNQPLRAVGTEPFWAVDITSQDLAYTAVDAVEVRASNPGPTVQGTTAVYAVTLSDGKTLTLTLTATECPDIGEETRALTSSLAIPGGMTQQACADARTAYPPET